MINISVIDVYIWLGVGIPLGPSSGIQISVFVLYILIPLLTINFLSFRCTPDLKITQGSFSMFGLSRA